MEANANYESSTPVPESTPVFDLPEQPEFPPIIAPQQRSPKIPAPPSRTTDGKRQRKAAEVSAAILRRRRRIPRAALSGIFWGAATALAFVALERVIDYQLRVRRQAREGVIPEIRIDEHEGITDSLSRLSPAGRYRRR